MNGRRILIAGIGNIFQGDDAFGVQLARKLAGSKLPDCVQVSEFGIRGFDLAYSLMDSWDAAVLLDATQRGGEPGTLYVIEPDMASIDAAGVRVETHGMDPVTVLGLVRWLGGQPPRLLVVGCEPATLEPSESGSFDLSGPVAAVLNGAVSLVESVVAMLTVESEPSLTQGAELRAPESALADQQGRAR